MKVITTFSQDGYELYGKRMVDTWLRYWPKEAELIVYTENFNLTQKDKRITELDINKHCPLLEKFKTTSINLKKQEDKKQQRKIDKAIRWSHKVYVISHALNYQNKNFLFLDGDTFTTRSVNIKLIDNLLRDHLFAVHFEQIKGDLHFETGLIAFNLLHPQIEILKNELQKGYDNLDVYKLPKAWDGFWFAHLTKKFNLDVLNLGNNGVFSNSLVSGTIFHDVGKKKFHNSSIEYDKYSGRKKQ